MGKVIGTGVHIYLLLLSYPVQLSKFTEFFILYIGTEQCSSGKSCGLGLSSFNNQRVW